jgi:hypothetical protein
MNKMELHISIDKADYWASAIVCARTNAILKVNESNQCLSP